MPRRGAPGWVLVLGLALAASAPAPVAADAGTDTVIAVRRDQVLIGNGFAGRVTVEVWSQDRIELVEEGSEMISESALIVFPGRD